uniref:Peptidase_S9 domain-containing protein n=1 Tax=Steinernema glaseri TaxID=37863 RepID=A0A1I7YSU2_9BILA
MCSYAASGGVYNVIPRLPDRHISSADASLTAFLSNGKELLDYLVAIPEVNRRRFLRNRLANRGMNFEKAVKRTMGDPEEGLRVMAEHFQCIDLNQKTPRNCHYGMILRPFNYQDGVQYPTIHYVYGGPDEKTTLDSSWAHGRQRPLSPH